MKKCIILLLSCFLFMPSCLRAYTDSNPFRMVYPIFKDSILNTYINKSDTIDLSNLSNDINGLSLDCKIYQISENSFVRILLEDSIGSNYIILENNRLRNSNDTVIFTEYCEETASLNNIKPKRIKLYIKDATILLEKIRYTEVSSNSNLDYGVESINSDSIKKWQTIKIVDEINKYNQENNKLWVAGVTNVSLMDYDAKKRVLGISDDVCDTKGFEYYVDGIFEIGETDSIDYSTNDTIESANSPYVESFDWRNRHGKNWMTPAKFQIERTCWAYASVAMLETYVNLYYNKNINYDLSEQDVISCNSNPEHNNYDGGHVSTALLHMRNNGIVDESSFPSSMNAECEDKNNTPFEVIRINNYNSYVYRPNANYLKQNIIKSPFVLDIFYEDWGHAVLLVGYKTINIGDTIISKLNNESIIIIDENNKLKGKTAWFFKNSYGNDWGQNGYGCFIIETASNLRASHILGSINSCVYTNEDIICSDNDGDGYYFWGIGIKPSNLPIWVPSEPDGDDSDARYGSMDSYGRLKNLTSEINDTIFITKPLNWNTDSFLWQHIVIKDNGVLNISSNTKCYKGVGIIVKDGGVLNINGGTLEEVNLKILSGGELNINNGGTIKKNHIFHTATNATVRISNGVIK